MTTRKEPSPVDIEAEWSVGKKETASLAFSSGEGA